MGLIYQKRKLNNTIDKEKTKKIISEYSSSTELPDRVKCYRRFYSAVLRFVLTLTALRVKQEIRD